MSSSPKKCSTHQTKGIKQSCFTRVVHGFHTLCTHLRHVGCTHFCLRVYVFHTKSECVWVLVPTCFAFRANAFGSPVHTCLEIHPHIAWASIFVNIVSAMYTCTILGMAINEHICACIFHTRFTNACTL